ncbi:hypothetical protein [Mucilaginibacter arboris]|uniref:Uncharacterized protein n=1 Tax=Mucilaginibacter arboris TaxID=2682090 RepID=A0A7K1SSV1_9SPHI|nr:hypothetical protein [Mucilaginibacter arboris]MVN20396.1 hypothetical protein [Mucilaginibacter arboris]
MDNSNTIGIKYRALLVETINKLEDFNSSTYNSILNLSMQGELKDIDDLFENGEVVNFKLADFRNLSDQNVQHLIEIMDFISEKYQILKNINTISDDDLLPF